jgi:hypothetical protein
MCIRIVHYSYRDLASVVLDACVILSFQGLIAQFLDALWIVLSMVYVWVVIVHVFTDGEVMRVNQLFVLQIVLTEVAAIMVPAFAIQDILDQIAPT